MIAKYNNEIFFGNVRKLRKQLGIKQTDMAEKLGISQNAYNRYELGNSKHLKYKRDNKIADILGTTVNELMIDNNKPIVPWDKVHAFRIKYNIPQSAMAEILGVSLKDYASQEITPPRKEYYIPKVTTDDEEFNALKVRTKEYVNSYSDKIRPKVSKEKAYNGVRKMVIEMLEMCIGNYANNKIMRSDYTKWIPGYIECGIVEECSPNTYRLTKEYAEPM